MKKSELRQIIKEEISKTLNRISDDDKSWGYNKNNINESSNKIVQPQKYLLLVWDVRVDDMNPPLLLAFTSNDEDSFDIPKGELADLIEATLNIKIDVDDFLTETISLVDFFDEYGNKINLRNKVYKIW